MTVTSIGVISRHFCKMWSESKSSLDLEFIGHSRETSLHRRLFKCLRRNHRVSSGETGLTSCFALSFSFARPRRDYTPHILIIQDNDIVRTVWRHIEIGRNVLSEILFRNKIVDTPVVHALNDDL